MLADKIIFTGLKCLGIPYVFNAPSDQTNMFDCSSFIQYILELMVFLFLETLANNLK